MEFKTKQRDVKDNTHTYKCAICGKEYSTILERSNCEKACCEKERLKQKAEKERKLKEEFQSRKEEINKDIIALNHKIEKFNKDYPNSRKRLFEVVDVDTYSFNDIFNHIFR